MSKIPSKRKTESLDISSDSPADHHAKRPATYKSAPKPTDLIENGNEGTELTRRHKRFATIDVSSSASTGHVVKKSTMLTTQSESSSEGEADSELEVKQVHKVEVKRNLEEMVSAPKSSIPKANHVLQTCGGCDRVPKTCICYAKAFPTEEDIANGAPRGSFIDLKRVPQFQGQFRDYSSGVTQYIQPFVELKSLAVLDRQHPVPSGRSRVDMYYEHLSRQGGDLDRIFSR